MKMQKFTYPGKGVFYATRQVDGVLIDPKLPRNFNNTANEERPAAHAKWWHFPYIEVETVEQMDAFYAGRTDEYAEAGRQLWAEGRSKWMAAWPSGSRYNTRCLDGGAWDRSTSWGMFSTIEEAIACANGGHRR